MCVLEWVRRIYEDGMHCAFTDMAVWGGHYYVCFRRAEQHEVVPCGDVFIIRSEDLEHWEVCGRITTGLDDRDPHLVPDGQRLWVFFGSRSWETTFVDGQVHMVRDGEQSLQSHASFTTDGLTWRTPIPVFEPDHWLWHPYRFEDGFYAVSYGERRDALLVRSPDGLDWQEVCDLPIQGEEAALARLDNGRLLAAVRAADHEPVVHFLEAAPPYARWTRWSAPHKLEGPALARVGNRIVAAGRRDDPADPANDRALLTSLHEVDVAEQKTRRLLDLPSGGDTSYCGLVFEDDHTLLVSYYSQHEHLGRDDVFQRRPASIYLARVWLS